MFSIKDSKFVLRKKIPRKIILDNIREYYNKLFDFSEAEDRILLKRKEQNIISIEDRIKKLTYT